MFWDLLNLWALIAVGKLLVHFGALKPGDSKTLNQLAFSAAVPALVFVAVYKIPSFTGMTGLPLAGMSGFLLFTLLAYSVGRLVRLSDKTLGGFILCVAQPNSMYIGFPIVLALLGADAMPSAVVYAIFTPVLTATLFAWIAAYYGGNKNGLKLDELLSPLTAAFLLGLLFNVSGIKVPIGVLGIIDQIGGLTTPLILIALGLSLDYRLLASKLIALTGLLRLIFAPIIAYMVASSFGLTGLALKVAVLELSMPPALVNVALASEHKLDAKFVDAAVLSLTLASMVTLPLLAYLLG